MTEALDDFLGYITAAGPSKSLRIFWFFVFFEFLRFFLFELTTLIIWRIGKKTRKLRYEVARQKLFIDRPLISIIVPGKNEGEHIYKLAMSMKEQSYTNFEFIVIGDGSDDDTERICLSLQKNSFIEMFFIQMQLLNFQILFLRSKILLITYCLILNGGFTLLIWQ